MLESADCNTKKTGDQKLRNDFLCPGLILSQIGQFLVEICIHIKFIVKTQFKVLTWLLVHTCSLNFCAILVLGAFLGSQL